MVPELIFQNPYVQGLVGIIIEQVAVAGYQQFKKLSTNKGTRQFLANQLLSCLEKSYLDICTYFSWEYNINAIEELLEKDRLLLNGENIENQLIHTLYQASGADETGIVDDEVIKYWLDSFFMHLSCCQELYNYINRTPQGGSNALSRIEVYADNKIYDEAFLEPLFLEAAVNDGKKALLRDVYMPAKYKVRTETGEKRIDISEMLSSFFNHRSSFTIQQDSKFPAIAFRIFAIMIMGKPGSGKSSFVSYLSSILPTIIPQRSYYIIRLRNMLKAQVNSVDPIQGLLEYMQTDMSMLKDSVLILDGLDEICAMYNRTDFHEYLKKLLQNLSTVQGLQLVITSRTGYFRIDNAIEHFCLVIHIENWDNKDLDQWSDKYAAFHMGLREIISRNAAHLKEEKYSDKKAIFAVPILFYMANARGELLCNHKSVCSVYDAVLTEVAGERHYDGASFLATGELIPPELARQICLEIAFAMFRNGRLNLEDQTDPYLAPDEVEIALADAIRGSNSSIQSLDEVSKKKIKDFYALTFYYSKNNVDINAVEFAHKTIAEYFAAEKILEILFKASELTTEDDFCRILSECFGYAPITTDIFLFIYEKIKIKEGSPEINAVRMILEKHFLNSVIDGSLFIAPKKYFSAIHYIDRISVMVKSVLLLYEYLECTPPVFTEM